MNTKEFVEKLQKDEELQKKFEGANNPEKFYEIASANGLTDDFETMKEEGLKLVKEITQSEELDLDKLTEIAGGSAGEVAATASSIVSLIGGVVALNLV